MLIINARLVNEGQVAEGDLRIDNGRIVSVSRELSATAGETVVDADGRWLLPGLIDDQVHFREPRPHPQGGHRIRKPGGGCGRSHLLHGNAECPAADH